jgi:TPR repeat
VNRKDRATIAPVVAGRIVVDSRGFVVVVGLGFLFVAAALAATQQDRTDCAAQDPARAIPACSRIIADSNESAQNRAGAYVLRSAVYLSQGNVERAIADCSEAIKLTPRNVIAYVRRALAYHRSGDEDHAILDYSIAEKLDAIGVAQFAAGNPGVEAVAAIAHASPPSPAALGLIIDQLPMPAQPEPPSIARSEPTPQLGPVPPAPAPCSASAQALELGGCGYVEGRRQGPRWSVTRERERPNKQRETTPKRLAVIPAVGTARQRARGTSAASTSRPAIRPTRPAGAPAARRRKRRANARSRD